MLACRQWRRHVHQSKCGARFGAIQCEEPPRVRESVVVPPARQRVIDRRFRNSNQALLQRRAGIVDPTLEVVQSTGINAIEKWGRLQLRRSRSFARRQGASKVAHITRYQLLVEAQVRKPDLDDVSAEGACRNT